MNVVNVETLIKQVKEILNEENVMPESKIVAALNYLSGLQDGLALYKSTAKLINSTLNSEA